MEQLSEYTGELLNHLETLYRPGERELAVELVEALGFQIRDTGFKGDTDSTFLGAHPNPDELDGRNNAFFMSEMTTEHQNLEKQLRRLQDSDATFADAVASYRKTARTRAYGVPHFGIRLRSAEALQAALERIETRIKPKLGDRIDVNAFWTGAPGLKESTLTQVFVHQDVIVSGSFMLGQVIELQVQR